jgi:hypothetical protein
MRKKRGKKKRGGGELQKKRKGEHFSLWPGLQALTAVIIKITVVWDLTRCSPVNVHRRFGWTYCLHLQDRRVIQTCNHHEAGGKYSLFLMVTFFAHSSTLRLEAVSSFETAVTFYRNTRHYSPEDSTRARFIHDLIQNIFNNNHQSPMTLHLQIHLATRYPLLAPALGLFNVYCCQAL